LPPLGDIISVNWRFRVPDGENIVFADAGSGSQSAVAGRDFGDFVVWRRDDTPSYQLATVVDDADFGITEVVRGADLIRSTFRQLLLHRTLGSPAPRHCHVPLLLDDVGRRLAKRHDALALRTLRARGLDPKSLLAEFARQLPDLTLCRS
jgi:glutamyl-tRNA synthetase